MGQLYDELDDAIRVAESNLSLLKSMAATFLEFSDHQSLTMGRINGIVREAVATPILPDATPAPGPAPDPTVNERLAQAQQQQPAPPPQKSWGQVLDEITTEPRHYTNGAVPKRTVAAR